MQKRACFASLTIALSEEFAWDVRCVCHNAINFNSRNANVQICGNRTHFLCPVDFLRPETLPFVLSCYCSYPVVLEEECLWVCSLTLAHCQPEPGLSNRLKGGVTASGGGRSYSVVTVEAAENMGMCSLPWWEALPTTIVQ